MARALDWQDKLQRGVSTLAFCLAVSALQFYFRPDIRYEMPLVYSVLIGMLIWALCDFGVHAFPSAAETGWPQGLGALLLPVGSIGIGYVTGTLLGDWWFGSSSWMRADTTDTDHHAQPALSLLISMVAGGIGCFYFYSRIRGQHLEQRLHEMHQQTNEARLKLLETQLEPHMLFNTLANLRALIGADPQRAQTMLDRMVDYLRSTLQASRNSTHSCQAEFDRLQDYLELMSIRMGHRLRYTLDLPETVRDTPIPPLLLQPIVENAIQHGLEPTVQGGSLTVQARRVDDMLELAVRDTGVGANAPPGMFPQPDLTQTASGFGLRQVRERIATAYGTRASVQYESALGQGTTVTLRLPL